MCFVNTTPCAARGLGCSSQRFDERCAGAQCLFRVNGFQNGARNKKKKKTDLVFCSYKPLTLLLIHSDCLFFFFRSPLPSLLLAAILWSPGRTTTIETNAPPCTMYASRYNAQFSYSQNVKKNKKQKPRALVTVLLRKRIGFYSLSLCRRSAEIATDDARGFYNHLPGLR